jgi:hypothetical protein
VFSNFFEDYPLFLSVGKLLFNFFSLGHPDALNEQFYQVKNRLLL